jgi:hypothetical protein
LDIICEIYAIPAGNVQPLKSVIMANKTKTAGIIYLTAPTVFGRKESFAALK